MKPIFAIKNLEIMRDKWKDPEYDISEQDASELLAYIAELGAEVGRLKGEMAERQKTYNEEADQFTDGFNAGEKGGLDPYYDQPHYKPDHDQWRIGYYAGSYERLTRHITKLEAENAELRNERTLYDNYMSDEAMRLIFANIKALEEEVTRLREQLRWIPITERKPERDGFYSALENINQVAGYYSWSKKSGWSDGRRKHIDSVTHWMHLPKLPEVEL